MQAAGGGGGDLDWRVVGVVGVVQGLVGLGQVGERGGDECLDFLFGHGGVLSGGVGCDGLGGGGELGAREGRVAHEAAAGDDAAGELAGGDLGVVDLDGEAGADAGGDLDEGVVAGAGWEDLGLDEDAGGGLGHDHGAEDVGVLVLDGEGELGADGEDAGGGLDAADVRLAPLPEGKQEPADLAAGGGQGGKDAHRSVLEGRAGRVVDARRQGHVLEVEGDAVAGGADVVE